MTMMRLVMPLLLSLVARQCGGSESIDGTRFALGYRVIQRRELQVSAAPSAAPFLPSFDGNLDVILEQALAKAALTAPISSPLAPVMAPSAFATSGTPSPAPYVTTPTAASRQACDGVDTTTSSNPLVFQFMYSLETTRHAEAIVVGSKAEGALNELLAPSVLSCLNEDAASAGIVMLDSLPVDSISSSSSCEPVVNATNSCKIWEGTMQIYLNDESLQEPARTLILAALQITLDSNALVDKVHHLVRTAFITSTDDGPVASVESPPGASQLDSSLGLTTTLLISVGSAAVLIVAGAIYFWKRSKTDFSVVDATATNGWNSTVLEESNVVTTSSPEGSVSPLSQMIPGAYGFSSNMSLMSGTPPSMSAIAEEQEHSISDNSSAIIMSEAGFSTTDDSSFMSLDVTKSNYIKNPEPESPLCLLGARAYNPVIDTSNMGDESDSDLSSDLEGNYRSATPIPATGALDSIPGEGFLGPPTGSGTDQYFDDSGDDDLLLFTQ